MKFIKELPQNPSFKQQGLNGYNYNLECESMSLTIEECFKGHDKYHTNVHSSKIYYLLDGTGKFKIDEKIYSVKKGDCIEIPPNTEFIFAGKMKLLLIMQPGFREQDGIEGKENDIW